MGLNSLRRSEGLTELITVAFIGGESAAPFVPKTCAEGTESNLVGKRERASKFSKVSVRASASVSVSVSASVSVSVSVSASVSDLNKSKQAERSLEKEILLLFSS